MGQECERLCWMEERHLNSFSLVVRRDQRDLASRGKILGKLARSTQHFAFINNFCGLYENPGIIWDAAHNRKQWENVVNR